MDAETAFLTPLLWTLPWVLFAVVAAVRVKEPPSLGHARMTSSEAPHVTVIIPARNEALNIGTSVGSVLRSDYPHFDLIVLDDRSEDGTADIAVQTAASIPGGAERLTVMTGEPLPEAWFGKPWACHQASTQAKGEVLLFTDADTRHDPELLMRSVSALRASGAHALTLIARQLMESFWERVIQPHVFFAIGWYYGNLRRRYDPALEGKDRWREAIANGQFIMVERDAYFDLGGHEAVAGEVVEDLRLAQEIVKAGGKLAMRDAPDVFETRMYRSLSELAEGWTKNLWTGGLQAFGRRGAALFTWAGVFLIFGFWVGPFVALLLSASAGLTSAWFVWSAATVAVSLIFWCAAMARVFAPAYYGITYPLGAGMLAALLARSALRGRSIEWKGRRYATD